MRAQWTGLLMVLLLALLPAHAQVQLARYLKQDAYLSIKISPDGQYYAATVPLEDRIGLLILRKSDGKQVSGASGSKESVVRDFWWAKDDQVVISMAERYGSRDKPYATGQLFGIGLNDAKVRVLVGPKDSPGLVSSIGVNPTWEMADVIDTLPNDPRNVLVSTWKLGTAPITRVEKLDVYTGRRLQVAFAPINHAQFLTDAAGQVRFALGNKDDNYSKLYYRVDNQAQWQLINDEASSGRMEQAVGFSADGVTAYLEVTQSKGPHVIVAWNTRTHARNEVLRDPAVDPYKVIYGRDGHTVLGAQYMDDGVHTRLLEDGGEDARLYRVLEKAFPDAAVDVTSYTRDGVALVQVWDDRTPGDMYLFDPHTMHAQGIFVAREWFDPAKLPRMRPVTVPVRDGLVLHGYLTLPLGAHEGQPLPMVMMPHGGPFGIFDAWEFDDDTQILAEAGYAVLRVNFRGSGNYGLAFQRAGARQWGGSMQDDLTDATRWAIAQQIADPSRICIYGASYGGYAALMGVAKEPGLYRCAVGYVGVYDLELMHQKVSNSSDSNHTFENDWVGLRGTLAANSPVTLAASIKAPVLLVAGGADPIAPMVHSKHMEAALRKAGVPVQTLYIDTEGHGFYTAEHRRKFYETLLDFLGRNLSSSTATH